MGQSIIRDKTLLRPNDHIIVIDGALEKVCKIDKVITQDRFYINYEKGKASSCRKKWVISRESIVRMATNEEIARAMIKG
jgi:hypothetical protein